MAHPQKIRSYFCAADFESRCKKLITAIIREQVIEHALRGNKQAELLSRIQEIVFTKAITFALEPTAKFLQQELTDEEVDSLIAFEQSPVGIKMREMSPMIGLMIVQSFNDNRQEIGHIIDEAICELLNQN